MIKGNLEGFTLIEMVTTLTIASALSLGLFFISLSANKSLTNDEVIYDVRSYSTTVLDIISEKIRNAEQVEINTQFGGGTTITTTIENEQFRYSIVNNMIYENSLPLKVFGYKQLEDQDLYDISIILNCSIMTEGGNATATEIKNNIYDLDITFSIESKINTNYQVEHTSSNRIFAINKFAQTASNS